jgi:hypothetical protein
VKKLTIVEVGPIPTGLTVRAPTKRCWTLHSEDVAARGPIGPPREGEPGRTEADSSGPDDVKYTAEEAPREYSATRGSI